MFLLGKILNVKVGVTFFLDTYAIIFFSYTLESIFVNPYRMALLYLYIRYTTLLR